MTMAPERPNLHSAEPEALPGDERSDIHFGATNVKTCDIDSVIILSQVRDRRHPRYEELKRSILSIGLLNNPDWVEFSPEVFDEYVEFVNELWTKDHKVEDYADHRLPDGYYRVSAAGNTRTAILKEIAEDKRKELGYHAYITTDAKVTRDATVQDLMDMQIDENIHSGVISNQEAKALIESYRWGLKRGDWNTPEEYRKARKGKVSKKKMDEILAFSELIPEIVDDALCDRIPYAAAVKLGKALPLMIQGMRAQAHLPFGPLRQEEQETINSTVETKQSAIAIHIRNHPTLWKNAPAANKYIESAEQSWRARITEADTAYNPAKIDIGFDEADTPIFQMATPLEQAKKQQMQELNEFKRALAHIARQPHTESTELLLKYGRRVPDMAEKIAEDVHESNKLLENNLVHSNEDEPIALFDDADVQVA